MRPLTFSLVVALALAACRGNDGGDAASIAEGAGNRSASGPDQLVLRVPRVGGLARVYAYPRVDSLVWASDMESPIVARVLAFDTDAGAIAIEDSRGFARSIDFRLGAVTNANRTKLAGLRSSDAWNVFGISNNGAVIRVTPSENRGTAPASWEFKPPASAREVIPQGDGALIIMADSGTSTYLWRIFPPEQRIVATAVLPHIDDVIRTPLGDRIYFTVDSGIIGVRSRTLGPVPSIRFRDRVRAVAATPSGDRLFVSLTDRNEIRVIDRYQSEVVQRIRMPAAVSELRMDPLGRMLLARAEASDTVWAIAIGSGRVVGATSSSWRPDLPTVAPDGAVAVAIGGDVVFLDPTTLQPREKNGRVRRGAADYWYFFLWSGFRPRAAELDQPVTFAGNTPPPIEPSPTLDSLRRAAAARRVDSILSLPPVRSGGRASGFMIQFAAFTSMESAQGLAQTLRYEQKVGHVVPFPLDAVTTVYRVRLGPFATREEAEKVAQRFERSYMIVEGPP